MPEKELNPEFVKAARKVVSHTPYFKLLGLKLKELEVGRAQFVMQARQKHMNLFFRVQGGAMASILDASCAWAVFSQLPDGSGVATVELKTSYADPGEAGQELVATAKTIKVGRRLGFVESRVHDQKSGRLLAFATATCAVIKVQPTSPLAGLPPKFL